MWAWQEEENYALLCAAHGVAAAVVNSWQLQSPALDLREIKVAKKSH